MTHYSSCGLGIVCLGWMGKKVGRGTRQGSSSGVDTVTWKRVLDGGGLLGLGAAGGTLMSANSVSLQDFWVGRIVQDDAA